MKSIRIILAIVLLAMILPTASVGAVSSKPVIGVTTAYTEKATTLEMAVFIESDEPIAAGSFDIQFDQSMVTTSKIALGEQLLTFPMTSLSTSNPGKISVAWAQEKNANMEGAVLTFSARVVAAGVGENIKFNLRNVHLVNAQGKKVSVQTVNGQIKPFDGKETEHSETVGVDKVWTVRLSEPYHPATLNDQAVSLKRGTVAEDIIITPLTDRSFQVKAKNPMRKAKHTLEITEQLSSANGSQLKEPVRHIFTVR